MHIIKPIQVKQIITDESKRRLRTKYKKQKRQLERECEQLLFEKRKLTNKLTHHKKKIKERFQQKINKRKEEITMLDFKLEQLKVLPVGTKLLEREVDALVKVTPGDNWDKIMKDQTIVIQDNIVLRIDDE